jgi:hypothetical protein
MRKAYFILLGLLSLYSCAEKTNDEESKENILPIRGTWKLISGRTIQQADTTYTDYTEGQETIKIIDNTHFAFLTHDLNNGKDTTATFVAGGGRFFLNDNHYTEHLDYCNFREWEGHTFEFDLKMNGDTLVQTGIEKVEGLGVDRVIAETYVRAKK